MFTQVNEIEVWKAIDHARHGISLYLHSLDHADWNKQSLCSDWLIRDVVAHLIIEYRYKPLHNIGSFVSSGFRVNTFLSRTASKLGSEPITILLARFDSLLEDRSKPKGVPLLNMLVDLLVHEQDIRIPLGRYQDMPLPSLELIFDHWRADTFNIGERLTGLPGHLQGLRFLATDIIFHSGTGELVEGSAQDILLAITGRKNSLKRLHGGGVSVLQSRL